MSLDLLFYLDGGFYIAARLTRPLLSCSSVLTGSYHNYFRIYDVETTNDIVLQADKSAFKAKKVGGVKGGPKGGKPGAGGMDTTGTDFNKKIVSTIFVPRDACPLCMS